MGQNAVDSVWTWENDSMLVQGGWQAQEGQRLLGKEGKVYGQWSIKNSIIKDKPIFLYTLFKKKKTSTAKS